MGGKVLGTARALQIIRIMEGADQAVASGLVVRCTQNDQVLYAATPAGLALLSDEGFPLVDIGGPEKCGESVDILLKP